MEPLAAVDGDPQALDVHTCAERYQGALRMIARGRRFGHRRPALGLEPGQDDGALDLGARRRRRVVDRLQVGTGDGQRRPAVRRLDARPHAGQRVDHPRHRPLAQRAIAADRRLHPMGGEDARHQADRGAGVAGVERAVGRLQPAEAAALDFERVVSGLPDAGTQGAQHGEGRGAVGAGRVAGNRRDAVGERAEHGVAMRDRLVARNAGPARDAACRGHDGGVGGGSHGRHYSIRNFHLIRFTMVRIRVRLQPATTNPGCAPRCCSISGATSAC